MNDLFIVVNIVGFIAMASLLFSLGNDVDRVAQRIGDSAKEIENLLKAEFSLFTEHSSFRQVILRAFDDLERAIKALDHN